jgi:magnesium-transporting ATPase (P-type)
VTFLGSTERITTTIAQEAPSVDKKNAPAHALASDQVLQLQQTSLEGLSQAEASARLQRFGLNQLPAGRVASALEILWGQINSPLIWVLIGSGVVAMAVDPEDGLKNGLVILGVVVLNTLVGFVQEYRAGRAIQALSLLVPENANVYRDGKLLSLPSLQIVPGDIIQLASGDKVPADVRLIKVKSLRVDEAALTGESVPTEKSEKPVSESAPLGDRTGMAFGGTLVTYGSATGVVTSTGSRSELGRINELMNNATTLETPLTKSLKTI